MRRTEVEEVRKQIELRSREKIRPLPGKVTKAEEPEASQDVSSFYSLHVTLVFTDIIILCILLSSKQNILLGKQAFARLNIPADYNSLNNGGHGYWSEGQALPNLRRHRERNGLPIHTADGAEDQEEGGQNQNRVMTTNGTPAPGYTGHMMSKNYYSLQLTITTIYTD